MFPVPEHPRRTGRHRDLASLSPRLLARKGGARPAMRSQSNGLQAGEDDLGWNDWGHDGASPVPAAGDIPEVLRQIETIVARLNGDAPRAGDAAREGRRAAFTLRLDAERHFRLRMAGVVMGRSAQTIVTEALDLYLSQVPDVAMPHESRRPAR